MMSKTHALWGITAASLITGSADPAVLVTAGLASQLPDVDTSKSFIGRLLLPLSRLLERHFPHRTVTHSFLATAVIVALAYPLRWTPYPLLFKAVVWGYFFGWFSDMFTRNGVAAFYPLTSARLVVPANPRLRLVSGSRAEWFIVAVLLVVLGVSLHVNTSGGLMRVFASAMGQPESVVRLWQAEGSRRRIVATIQGRFAASGANAAGNYDVVDVAGETLLVRAADGTLYQAGAARSCGSCQIQLERVKGRTAEPVKVETRELRFDDRAVSDVMRSIRPAAGARLTISGELTLKDAALLSVPVSLQHFNPVTVSGGSDAAKVVRLHVARLSDLERLAEYFGDGQLLIREVSDAAKK